VPANPLEPYTLHVAHLKSPVIIDLKIRLPYEEDVANGRRPSVTEDSRKLQDERGDGLWSSQSVWGERLQDRGEANGKTRAVLYHC